MNYDFLIVGQGLAGTALSSLLYEKGITFKVIDNNLYSSSSMVAAGLYNPIVFKRLVKSWMIDELLPFSDVFYRNMEVKLGKPLYHKKNIVKVFVNEAEKELWLEKSKTPECSDYLSSSFINFNSSQINYQSGGAEVLQAGYLDVPEYLSSWRNFLHGKNLIEDSLVDYSLFELTEKEVRFNGNIYKKVVFCEGYQSLSNPYFGYLPFVLTKGDLLKVRIQGLETDYIYNKGVFVLPLQDQEFLVGSTYQWIFENDEPEPQNRMEIEQKLAMLLSVPFETMEHYAGIRPTVKDRRPFLGVHPKINQMVIFNGLGTKGVLLAPYFAEHLLNHLLSGNALNPEVDIVRYSSLLP